MLQRNACSAVMSWNATSVGANHRAPLASAISRKPVHSVALYSRSISTYSTRLKSRSVGQLGMPMNDITAPIAICASIRISPRLTSARTLRRRPPPPGCSNPLLERVLELSGVRDVVLEEAPREAVVLLDGHMRFAREVVVAEASEPGAERRPPQHHRPERTLHLLQRAVLRIS